MIDKVSYNQYVKELTENEQASLNKLQSDIIKVISNFILPPPHAPPSMGILNSLFFFKNRQNQLS